MYEESIDIACIQETHLKPKHIFSVRGCQVFRLDREERHKGAVGILVKNDIPIQEVHVNTYKQSKAHGMDVVIN